MVVAVLAALAVAAPATAQEESEGESARGSVKIEEIELAAAPDLPNEVKVGCGFSLDFFGFEEQTVPVRLSLQPPSGERQLTARTADLQGATGNELSGRLAVDLTKELSEVAPADAEDFDYKVRVEVVVKETEGTEVTKNSMLFVDCDEAVRAYGAAQEPTQTTTTQTTQTTQTIRTAGVESPGEDIVRPTGVAAGSGGLATDTLPLGVLVAMVIGGLGVAAAALVPARRRMPRD